MDAGQAGLAGDSPGRLDAIEYRHPDVHQQHVRPVPGRQLHGFVAVSGLANYGQVFLGVKQCREARPHQNLVVRKADANHRMPPAADDS